MPPDRGNGIADLGDGGQQLLARHAEPLRPLIDGRVIIRFDRLRRLHLRQDRRHCDKLDHSFEASSLGNACVDLTASTLTGG